MWPRQMRRAQTPFLFTSQPDAPCRRPPPGLAAHVSSSSRRFFLVRPANQQESGLTGRAGLGGRPMWTGLCWACRRAIGPGRAGPGLHEGRPCHPCQWAAGRSGIRVLDYWPRLDALVAAHHDWARTPAATEGLGGLVRSHACRTPVRQRQRRRRRSGSRSQS